MQWCREPHNEEVNSIASYPGHIGGGEMWLGYEEINSQPTTNHSDLNSSSGANLTVWVIPSSESEQGTSCSIKNLEHLASDVNVQ